MKRLLFLILTITVPIHWCYSQEQPQEIIIENGLLAINGNQVASEITVNKLDELLKEKGRVVKHKKKKFKDRHHGTRHVIPKYVEIIYNKSGLVFQGTDESKISELQINFQSKALTEKYVLTVLEKEYDFRKNDIGFNLSKRQHQKAFKEIYLKTFEPWTEHQYSGRLIIENQKISSEISIFDSAETIGNLFEDSFFDKNISDVKFSCIVPASAVVVGFCECFSNGIRLTLFGEDMNVQMVNYSLMQK